MPLRRSLVSTACRWFQPPSSPHIETMATASTTSYVPTSAAKDVIVPPTVPRTSTTSVNNGKQKSPSKTMNGTSNNGSNKSNKESIPKSLNCHVNFGGDDPDLSDRKKKYLTAKYGQHQMNLIKKRLRVEMWMYEQLATLYDTNDSSDLEIDLDELLDLEDEKCREKWLREKVIDAKRSPKEVDQFVFDLLERAKTL